jgi:manganese/zinc/iron transport system ATP- binding protein
VIKINDLSIKYDSNVVFDNLSISFPQGALIGLIGPNGAGKSTLIKAIDREIPFSGTIDINGARIARVFQKPTFNPVFPMSIRELLTDINSDFKDIVATLHLSEVLDKQLTEVSGGQSQKALVARALLLDADILLFDEPLVGVDKVSEKEIFKALKNEVAKNKTVIVSHHDLSTLELYFDYLVFLNHQIIAQGATEKVLNHTNLKNTFGATL